MANTMPSKLTAPLRSLQPKSDRDPFLTNSATSATSNDQVLPGSSPTPMPSKLTSLIIPFQSRNDRIGMFLNSDDQLLIRHVEGTHVPDGSRQIAVKPLFQLAEDILVRATQALQGALLGAPTTKETIEGKSSSTALVNLPDLPLIIERVSCEMSCKSWAGSDAHDATLSVLKLLAHFPWEAKAILTLAAFSLTYGEFWLLAQIYSTNPLAKSMALLKQLPLVMEHSGSFKSQFDAINKLIKAILNVARCIVDFKELPSAYITEDEPMLKAVWSYFPLAVYWTIRSTVGAAAHITSLTSRSQEYLPSATEAWELSNWQSNWEYKLQMIYEYFTGTMRTLLQLIERKREDEAYDILRKFIYEMIHIDNIPVLNRIVGIKDDPQPIFDCSTKRRVQLEVLRRKNVLLLISDLNISPEELSMLEQIYNDSKIHQYEIVWLPIIDHSIQWSDALQAQFERLQASMQWYSIYHPTKIGSAVIKFVKDVWNFRSKPILVVLDPQGKVVSPNAIHMMWIWGSTAFPFTSTREEALWREESWKLELLVDAIDPTILDWIRDGKYIFLYGGDDIEWVRKFTREARAVAESAGIKLEMVYVGRSHAKKDVVRKVTAAIMANNLSHCWQDPTTVWFFWQRIESMLLSKIQLEQVDNHSDTITQEIKKLLSYDKSPGGWAVLTKGSAVLLHEHGSTIYTALTQYEQEWKREIAVLGFDKALSSHVGKFDIREAPCCRFDFPAASGRVPTGMRCPECQLAMEKHTTFICCHELGAAGLPEFTAPVPPPV
ncbi:hypothetical protein Dimus_018320 [Dionaea muscipula]